MHAVEKMLRDKVQQKFKGARVHLRRAFQSFDHDEDGAAGPCTTPLVHFSPQPETPVLWSFVIETPPNSVRHPPKKCQGELNRGSRVRYPVWEVNRAEFRGVLDRFHIAPTADVVEQIFARRGRGPSLFTRLLHMTL